MDLGAIYASYEEKEGGDRRLCAGDDGAGAAYGYCKGIYSSRKIQAATYEDVGFRYLAADEHPTTARWRSFGNGIWGRWRVVYQALQLCQKAGLVKLGHVAIDGSKLQGNASKHKAMSYERMGETEKRLQAEVEEILKRADAEDAAEDAKYGKGQSGEELPAELARRESRLAKIRAAKAELEAEAREKAEEKKAAAEGKIAERREQEARTGKKTGGREPQVPDPEKAMPEAKAQRNFTDPDSRIMPDGSHKGSLVQGYNAQVAVDGEAR